jgi:hypothetical protein
MHPSVNVRSSNGGQHDVLIESVIEKRERPVYHRCVIPEGTIHEL